MHVLAVRHRWTLYENVDSAKIKVPFYTTDIEYNKIIVHITKHKPDNKFASLLLVYIYIYDPS